MPPPRRFLQSGAVNTAEGSITVQLSFSSSSSSASLESLFSFVCCSAPREREMNGANDEVGSDSHHHHPPSKRFSHQKGRRRMEITVPSLPIKKGAVTLAGWNKILTVLAESVFASCSCGDDAESNNGKNDLKERNSTSYPSTTLDDIADRQAAFLAFLAVVPTVTATTTTTTTVTAGAVVAPSYAGSAEEEMKVHGQPQQKPESANTSSSSGDAAKKRLVQFFAKGGSATLPSSIPPPPSTSTTSGTSTEEFPNSSHTVASATTATPPTAAAAVVACSEGAVWLDLATSMVVMGNLQDGWTVRWENMASMLHEAFVGSSTKEEGGGGGEHENNNTSSSVGKNHPGNNVDAASAAAAAAGEDHKRLVRVLQGHGVSSLISQPPHQTLAELAKAIVDEEGNTPHVAPQRPAAQSALPIMRRVAIAFDEVMLLHESPLSRVPETPLRYQRALEAFLNAAALPQLPLDLYLSRHSSLPSNSAPSSTNKSTTANHQSNNDKNNTEMPTSLPTLPDVCFSTKPFEEWLSDSTLCLLTSSSQAATTTPASRSSAKSAAACVSFDELLRLPHPIKETNDPLPNRKGKPLSPPPPRKKEGEMEEKGTEMKNDDACIEAEESYLPLRVVKRLLEPLWDAALKAIQPLVVQQQQQQQPDHNGDPPESADVTTHRRGPTGRPSRSVSPTTRGSHRHPSHSLATLLLRDCVVRWPSRLAHDFEIAEGPLLPPATSSSSYVRSNILGCSKPNESAKKEEEQGEKRNDDTINNNKRAASYVRSDSPLKESDEQQHDTTILQAHDMAQYASFLHEGTSLLDHVAPAQRKTDVYCSSTALPQSVLERKSIPPMAMVLPRASSSAAKKTNPVTTTPNNQPSCQTAETEANIADTTALKPSGRESDEATGGSVVENEPCSPPPPPPPTASLKHSGSSLAVRCAVAAAIDLVLAVYFGSEEEKEEVQQQKAVMRKRDDDDSNNKRNNEEKSSSRTPVVAPQEDENETQTQSERNSTTATTTATSASSPLAAAEAERRLPPEMAFALIRPPGHHCSHTVPGGFCLVNNVVLAIRALQQEALARHQRLAGGASSSSSRSAPPFQKPRVAILDLDVHHGEGTQALVEQDPSILFLSVHRHDHGAFYPYSKVEGTAAYRGPHKTVWNVAVQTSSAAAPAPTPGTSAQPQQPQSQDSAIAQVAPSSSPSEKEDLPPTDNDIQPPLTAQQHPAGVAPSSAETTTTTTTPPPAVHRVLSDSLLREAWCHIVEPALQEFQPDLILVSLGFDAAFGDPLGGSAVVRGYEDFFRALTAFVDDTKVAAKRFPKEEPRGQQQQRCGGDENSRESRSDDDDDDSIQKNTKARRSVVCRGVVAVLEGGYHPQVVAQQSLAVLRSMLWRDPLSSSSFSCCTASENGRYHDHHHHDRSCSFSSSSMVWPIDLCVPPPTLVVLSTTASSSPPVLVGSKHNNNNNSNSNKKSSTLQERWNNHLQWAAEEIKQTAEQLFSSSS